MKCPNCLSKNLGKIASDHFYCWNCFIELSLIDGQFSMNQVEEDGSLTSLDDIFNENERTVEI